MIYEVQADNDLITKEDFTKLHYSRSSKDLSKWTEIKDKTIPQELQNVTDTNYKKMIVSNCINTAIDMYTLLSQGEQVRIDKKIVQVQDKFDEIIKLLEAISDRANYNNIKVIEELKTSINTDLTYNELIKIEVPRFELTLEEAGFELPEIKKVMTYLKKALRGNTPTIYPVHIDTGLTFTKD